MAEMILFSGNANSQLANEIAAILRLPLTNALVDRFSDGEIHINILDNVRGKDVFIIQPTCRPANDNLMELLLMADAIRRASAVRITAVMPYFGYARQDRRVRSERVPISCRLVADMLSSVEISRILTVDLHSEQTQGFFNIPVDNTFASQILIEDIKQLDLNNFVLVSPDVGGVVRARQFAKRLNDADLAIINKRRPAPNQSEVMHIIGEVEGRNCILVDDMIDTAGTLCQAASALKERGALSVYAYCTHPVFSGQAIENIAQSQLDEVIVTNTIPLTPEASNCEKIRMISIAPMLSEAMHRVHQEKSLSCMFD